VRGGRPGGPGGWEGSRRSTVGSNGRRAGR